MLVSNSIQPLEVMSLLSRKPLLLKATAEVKLSCLSLSQALQLQLLKTQLLENSGNQTQPMTVSPDGVKRL